MEPDVIINCGKKCNNKCKCYKIILGIIGILLAFVVGILVQNAFDIVATLTLAYFTVITTIFIIAIILIALFASCICKRL